MENSHNTEDLLLNPPILNPMVFHQGFQHISEQIFEKMDNKSLKNCREVAKSWQNCIDNRNILWNKIAKKNGSTKSFQLACQNGHHKLANVLIQNANKFKIEATPERTREYSANLHAPLFTNWRAKY